MGNTDDKNEPTIQIAFKWFYINEFFDFTFELYKLYTLQKWQCFWTKIKLILLREHRKLYFIEIKHCKESLNGEKNTLSKRVPKKKNG